MKMILHVLSLAVCIIIPLTGKEYAKSFGGNSSGKKLSLNDLAPTEASKKRLQALKDAMATQPTRVEIPVNEELCEDFGIRDAREMFDAQTGHITRLDDGIIMLVDQERAWGTAFPCEPSAYMREHGRMFKIMFADSQYTLIGQVKIYIPCNEDWPAEELFYGYLALLKIEPAFRGFGYGKKLMNEAYKLALSFGISNIMLGLWHGKENYHAYQLYQKEGFVHDPTIQSEVHTFVMLKKLKFEEDVA